MKIEADYPTEEHEKATEAVVDFFSSQAVDALILYGSCARGRASKESCIDFLALLKPEAFQSDKKDLENRWNEFYRTEDVFKKLKGQGQFSHVDLDFTDGNVMQKPRGFTDGPDEFELEIGNTFLYSVPLLEKGDHFKRLKEKWLPYYDENLRRQRLDAAFMYCRNNLGHIPIYVHRGLHFQAFKRLYDASREFLQALFISKKTYPISYDKWIKEQIVEILKLPKLYPRFLSLYEIRNFESDEIEEKGEELGELLKEYVMG